MLFKANIPYQVDRFSPQFIHRCVNTYSSCSLKWFLREQVFFVSFLCINDVFSTRPCVENKQKDIRYTWCEFNPKLASWWSYQKIIETEEESKRKLQLYIVHPAGGSLFSNVQLVYVLVRKFSSCSSGRIRNKCKALKNAQISFSPGSNGKKLSNCS